MICQVVKLMECEGAIITCPTLRCRPLGWCLCLLVPKYRVANTLPPWADNNKWLMRRPRGDAPGRPPVCLSLSMPT